MSDRDRLTVMPLVNTITGEWEMIELRAPSGRRLVIPLGAQGNCFLSEILPCPPPDLTEGELEELEDSGGDWIDYGDGDDHSTVPTPAQQRQMTMAEILGWLRATPVRLRAVCDDD